MRGEAQALTWSAAAGRDFLRVTGCRAEDVGRLAVVPTECVELGRLQPTAGRFEIVLDEIRFVPRFPLVPGTCYALLFDGAVVASAALPAHDVAPVTRVEGISPTAGEVPLNLLKLYIQFSRPMSEGWASRAVSVRRAGDGQAVPGVFLPMPPELWDHRRRRLTLLLDPGRIKRGLAPHAELGYPLQQGVAIVVAVDRSFRDADGLPLLAGIERRFEVGPAVRQHVTPAAWHLRRPASGSTHPLRVDFDRPLDRALLEHSLAVVGPDGRAVDGQETILEDDREWSFTPLATWRSAGYHLCVDPRLEDLAGNSLNRVFDRDLTRIEDAPNTLDRAVVEFWPGD